MLRKKEFKRGDLIAVLNPSLLPKSERGDSRAAAVEDEDQILQVQTLAPKSSPVSCTCGATLFALSLEECKYRDGLVKASRGPGEGLG